MFLTQLPKSNKLVNYYIISNLNMIIMAVCLTCGVNVIFFKETRRESLDALEDWIESKANNMDIVGR